MGRVVGAQGERQMGDTGKHLGSAEGAEGAASADECTQEQPARRHRSVGPRIPIGRSRPCTFFGALERQFRDVSELQAICI